MGNTGIQTQRQEQICQWNGILLVLLNRFPLRKYNLKTNRCSVSIVSEQKLPKVWHLIILFGGFDVIFLAFRFLATFGCILSNPTDFFRSIFLLGVLISTSKFHLRRHTFGRVGCKIYSQWTEFLSYENKAMYCTFLCPLYSETSYQTSKRPRACLHKVFTIIYVDKRLFSKENNA